MKNYSLLHLTDGALLSGLSTLVSRDRGTTAEILAHIAEVDARKLYVPAAHPSMFSYCVHELRLSEDAASKRIQAARVARQFPAIFHSLADGRLHLSAVVLLAPWLEAATADDLLAAAANKTKPEIEQLLAERFPRPDVASRIEAIAAPASTLPLEQHAPGHVESLATGRVDEQGPHPRVTPLAPERFALKLTIGQEAHDELRYAQSLLGKLSTGDLPEVIARAIHELVTKLEKQKFATTDRPRKGVRRSSENPRHIPAHVKRAVLDRDQGQCTFVSEAGKRCPCTSRVEFDHILEVARGGEASVANLRLRCRAHNQYTAELAFGAEYMASKRQEARVTGTKARDLAAAAARVESENPAKAMAGDEADEFAAEEAHASGQESEEVAAAVDVEEVRAGEQSRAEAAATAEEASSVEPAKAAAAAAEWAKEQDVIPWLRTLGIRVADAREAARLCDDIPDAPLDQRVRRALTYFGGRARKIRAA